MALSTDAKARLVIALTSATVGLEVATAINAGDGSQPIALASTANALGASLVGIEDALGLLTATGVESALAELVKYVPVNLADPGTGVAIPVTRSANIAVTTAAAETNTLAIPTFVGQRLILSLDVRAVGNRVITSAQRINTAGNTVITLDTAGDAIVLEAIRIAGVLRWQVVSNDGATLT